MRSMKISKQKIPQDYSTKKAIKPRSYCCLFKIDERVIETGSKRVAQTSTKNMPLRTAVKSNDTVQSRVSLCVNHKEVRTASRGRCSRCENYFCNCKLNWKEGISLLPDFFPQTFDNNNEIKNILSNQLRIQRKNATSKQNACQRTLYFTNVLDDELIFSWMRYFGHKDSNF